MVPPKVYSGMEFCFRWMGNGDSIKPGVHGAEHLLGLSIHVSLSDLASWNVQRGLRSSVGLSIMANGEDDHSTSAMFPSWQSFSDELPINHLVASPSVFPFSFCAHSLTSKCTTPHTPPAQSK